MSWLWRILGRRGVDDFDCNHEIEKLNQRMQYWNSVKSDPENINYEKVSSVAAELNSELAEILKNCNVKFSYMQDAKTKIDKLN